MKFAYLGYDAFFYCLEELISCGHTPTAVVSFPVDGVYERNDRLRSFAEERGLPFSEERVTKETLSFLAKRGADLIFVAGYAYRLPADGKIPLLNFHPSPLPVGRGAWPMPTAILRGESLWGCAVHKVAEGFDTGDLLMRRVFLLSGRETLPVLEQAIEDAARPMLREVFCDLPAALSRALPQTGGDYRRDPPEPETLLTPSMPGIVFERMARAFYGYGFWIETGDGRIRVIRGEFFPTGAALPTDGRRFPVRDGTLVAAEWE